MQNQSIEIFFQKHYRGIAASLIFVVLIIFVLVFMLFTARDLQLETLERIDQPIDRSSLLGSQGKISDRTREQLDTILYETPHVLGGWIAKIKYDKMENSIIHSWTRSPIVANFIEEYARQQLGGEGFSSAELDERDKGQVLRNSEEAKLGLIKCGALSDTNLPIIYPPISRTVKGVCRATIPPFNEDVNLSIIVAVDIDGSENSPEIQEVRRQMLRLQIDLFNREYQGRETWGRIAPRVPATVISIFKNPK